MGKKYTTDIISIGDHSLDAPRMVQIDDLIEDGLHSEAGYLTEESGTTRLTDAEIAEMGYIKTYTDTNTNTQLSQAQVGAYAVDEGFIKEYTDTNTQLTSAQIAAMGYASSGFDSIANLSAPNTTVGTWNTATTVDWGTPRIGSSVGRYIDNAGSLSFAVPAGMKTAYISQLTWSSGGYADVYGIQADGDAIFLRRINTKQNVENSNHSNPNQHDGSTIAFAGHIGDYPTIRISNKSGRLHLTGLGFSKSEVSASDGTGMVNPSQFSTPVTYSSISGTPSIPSGNSIIDWTTNQGGTNIHSGNYTNTTYDLSGYLTTAGKAADSNLLDGLNSTAYMRDDGWNTSPGQDANTQTGMRSDFSYGNNAPNVGELLRFGAGNYSTQFSSQYGGAGKGLNFRTRNGDSATYNPWYGIWHTGNLTSNSQLTNGSNYVSYVNTDQIGASSFYDLNDSNYFLDLNATSRLNRLQTVSTGVNKNSSSTTKDGLSLYGAYTGGEATYGMMFSGTAGSGTHGGVTSDWATYFTMNNSTNRGWIFRRAGAGNSASISAGGLATFDGSVRSPIFYDSDNTGYYVNPAGTSNINELNVAAKRTDFSSSSNWDEIGFSKATNLHMNGHNQFWIGAGNGTWFTGTANAKTQASGLAADATSTHDLLITTMQGTSTTDRGITFAVDSNGAGTAGWRLGKFHSGTDATDSMFAVDGQLRAKGGYTDEYDYYGNDYSSYYNDGQAHWAGDSNAGWHKPSIVASSAIQIQSGNGGTNSRKPQIQFHQYGYGGPAIQYDGPNKKLQIGMINTSTAGRFNTFSLKFGSNEAFIVNTDYAYHNSDMRAPVFYDTNNTGYYVNPASTSNLNGLTVNGTITGNISGNANTLDNIDSGSFLRSDATDYQNNTIYQRGYLVNETGYRNRGVYGNYSSTKTNHIWSMGVAYKNHASGTNFGNLYGLAYKHTNNTTGGNMAGGHQMVWCSNGTGRSAMGDNIWTSGNVKAPLYYDSNNTGYYTNPAGTSVVQRITHINHSTPILIKVNSGYKSWVHHVSSSSSYIFAPSTANGGESWDWANQMSISTSGVVTANNFVLSSDKRSKTKIKDLTCDNIDVSWKSFEMKGNEGDYRTGVIAQELEETNPEFVNTDEKGFKSVKYIDLLIAKIAELEARLEKLEK